MTDPRRDELAQIEVQMRQLALVDRIIGLEAQVAHLSAGNSAKALDEQLKQVKSSTTWKVGRVVLSPVLAVNRLLGRKKTK